MVVTRQVPWRRHLPFLGIASLLLLIGWFQYSYFQSMLSQTQHSVLKSFRGDEPRTPNVLSSEDHPMHNADDLPAAGSENEGSPLLYFISDTNSTSEVRDPAERMQDIKKAMQFAYGNYETYAFGADELGPVSGSRKDSVWGGIAITMLDALDTLYLMDMTDEFNRARDFIANNFTLDQWYKDDKIEISIFETTIRAIGGLLSAHQLSNDFVFLEKAKVIADALIPAFDPKAQMFRTVLKPASGKASFGWRNNRRDDRAPVADIGTIQLEFRTLSRLSRDPKYAQMGDWWYHVLRTLPSYRSTGLYPAHFDPRSGHFVTSSPLTLGAFADSFYEYLLKVYIHSGKRPQDTYLKQFYDEAVNGIEKYLLEYSTEDQLYYLKNLGLPGMKERHSMDHLTCFTPGLLALGSYYEVESEEKKKQQIDMAKKLMETCYQMYAHQPSGLSPENVKFPGMKVQSRNYVLRPETMESLFYLYRVTGDTKYRDQGWEIFQSIEKHCRTTYGYGSVKDVTTKETQVEDVMESFFLSETLKYAYLLQAPETLLPLDEYVFNTEAHPLRIEN